MAQTMRFLDGRRGRVVVSSKVAGGVLPPALVQFFRRRLAEIWGIALLSLAVFLITAVATFPPGDTSLNSAGGGLTGNILGVAGAIVADLALQTFGIASLVPALAFLAWSWRMMTKRGVSVWGVRLALLVAAMMFGAAAVSAMPPPAGWPLMTRLGGVVGSLIYGHFADAGQLLKLDPSITAAIVAVLALAALVPALGLSRHEWQTWGRVTTRLAQALGHGARAGRDAFGVMPAWRPIAATTTDESSSNIDVDNDIEPAAVGTDGPQPAVAPPSRTGIVEAKKSRLKLGRRVYKERQGKLNLGSKKDYQAPPLDILDKVSDADRRDILNKEALQQNASFLGSVLEDFGVRGEIVKVRPGPVITLYELEPAPGTKTSRVIGLADDIARSMSAVSVRIAVVPGRSVIGIELPNVTREMVNLRELLASETFEKASAKLPLALGKDIGGAPVIVDLARMPHLLIAGTTGSGKSVAMNTMILSLLYRMPPEECKFIMIDPKMLELSVYEGIPHLLTPVVTESSKAIVALKWTVREMEERYRAMSQLGVRNIRGYNARLAEARRKGETLMRRVQTGFDENGKPIMEDQPLDLDPLPLIVVVVDEMADLMMVAGKDLEASVQRLAQMARAAGIHLIMATQRPSVDVITGTIKANFPTRISFQVTSKIDSRTILGEQGAEQLLGQGDMLYMIGGGRISRVHGPFVSDEEVERVVKFMKRQGEPVYIDEITEEDAAENPFANGVGRGGDDLYDDAVALIAREGKASTSFIQRHLQIGYNRAARIIEQMESEGIVSPANRVGRREVLVGRSP
jgi:DNA segregation ATPase FtsK/SpoIIIE, S-DNA-T family